MTARGPSDAEAVELLRGAVEIPSLSREEARVASFLVERMRAFGFDAHIDEAGNAVGERRGGAGGEERTIVLLGHMDTAPGWIPVRLDGDTLHGRGSVDAKGPLCAFIAGAARAVLPAGARVVVVGAVEEEAASSKGARHVSRWPAPRACLIGEPSGWEGVTLGYKGRLLATFRASQASGHTAGPTPAVAECAVEWWIRVRGIAERFNEGRERLFEKILPTLRELNTTSDGLRDDVSATVGLRLPPGIDIDALEREVVAAGEAVGGAVESRGRETAWSGPRSSEAARAVVRAIREEGGTPHYSLKTGTADMNVVGPVWGCPIVAYGPGDSLLDHTPEERISIGEYLRSVRVTARAVESLLA